MSDPAYVVQVHPVPGHGAEDVVVASSGPHEGAAYTGTEDGAILRVSYDGARVEVVAQTGGRPLGIELLPDGLLLVCDARRGLVRVDPGAGTVDVVLDQVQGRAMRFCNNAAVAADGTVWFSDSSTRFGIDRWRDELVQDTRTGRLLSLAPDGSVQVELAGLSFANGVALAADDSWVCVAETAARRVVRRWLTGERAGQHEVLVADLPGYPDNVSRGSDGLIWVALTSPPVAIVGLLQAGPSWLARQATRVPQRLQPSPVRAVRAQAFDDEGGLVHDVDLDATRYHLVTGVREHDGRLWLSSLEEGALATVSVRDLHR